MALLSSKGDDPVAVLRRIERVADLAADTMEVNMGGAGEAREGRGAVMGLRALLHGQDYRTNPAGEAGTMIHPVAAAIDLWTGRNIPRVALADGSTRRSVRAQLEQLVQHPEIRDEVIAELEALLSATPGKQHRRAA